MGATQEALMSYPPSVLAVLCATAALLLLVVGVGGTAVHKDASERFALATTIGPAAMALLALTIMAFGASSGVAESVDGWMEADPSMRSVRLAEGISTSLWSTVLGSGLLVALVPAVAFGCATVWGLRARREGEPALPLFLAAAGAAGPSFLLGSLIVGKATGFIQMFGAVAFGLPEDRVEMVRTGIAEIESPLASSVGIVVLFLLGFGVAAAGAVLAARARASAPSWAIVLAAFFAFAGVTTALSSLWQSAHVGDLQAIAEELEPLPAHDPPEDELDY